MLILATSVQNTIDLAEIFYSSPIIYSILLFLSMTSCALWLYCLCTFRTEEIIPKDFLDSIKVPLDKKEYQKILTLCEQEKHPFAKMVFQGLHTRASGLDLVLQSMQSQGKRCMASYWQKLSVLHDIAAIAPMFGLFGTILGMFYAFYDINRSVESIHALFDGFGIAIGTTLMGLVVAISSMIFYAFLKQRLLYILHILENEAWKIGHGMISSQQEGLHESTTK